MGERRRPRLADGLRGFLGQALETAQTRVELLAVEVQEEKLRLTGLLFNILLCALLLAFGIVFLLIFLTVLLWEEHRLLTLGIATGGCLLAALLTATNAARELRRGSRLFAASLAELARDRAALKREE